MFARAIATDAVRAALDGDAPKAGDFVAWSSAVADTVAAGASAKERRSYLKTITAEAWSLCGWLTHAQNATRFDAHLALDAAERRESAGLESPADLQPLAGRHRWAMGDLNARPLPCRGSALTPELIAR